MRAALLESLAQLHRYDDLEHLLDFVAETLVANSGWSTALLTFYFGDDASYGACGCPDGTKERFRERSLRTSTTRREQKRREILGFRRPSTNICFIPAGEGPSPGPGYVPSAEVAGSWHPDDRLLIVLWDWEDRILGVLSLDNPKNGDRPGTAGFRELGEIDTYVNLVAKIAENRFWSLRLQEREAAYRGIFNAATDGFIILEPDGTIVEVNPSTCRMHGYTREELVGRPARDLVHPSSWADFATFLHEAGAGREVRVDGRSLRKDGTVLDAEVRGVAFHYQGQRRLLAVLQDVTEKKLVFQQVLDQQKDESIVAVAGGVAHDFNNLLMGITGSLDLLQAELRPGSAAIPHCERIARSATRLSQLTDQLRAIARGVRSRPQQVSLTAIVVESLPLLEGLVGSRFRLDMDLAHDDTLVYGDRVQLRQLLLNLCQNAVEAMRRGGNLRIATRSVERTRPWSGDRTGSHDAGAYVRLLVQDDGAGMEEATKRRIFEPYFSTKADGSGLGLAATLGIVRRHQGAISVHSEPSGGTTVEVLLPLAEEMAATPAPTRNGKTHRRRVLLVDDNEVVLEAAGEMLKALDCEVTPVDSGEKALELYEARPSDFDLVLLDVSMPGMSGIETHEALHELDSDVLVVLSSGHTERLVREDMEGSATIAAFLQKPYHLGTLGALLDRVLQPEADASP